MIQEAVGKLAAYGLERGLLEQEDLICTVNSLLEALQMESWDGSGLEGPVPELAPVLEEILDYGVSRGLLGGDTVTYRDLFDTKLMGRLTPRPSQVIKKFRELYGENPQAATDWYYQFSQDTNYIRRDRIKRDLKWKAETPYGEMDITINLSKPEKDPKAIAAARNSAQSGYPKCQLCMENEGYAGRLDHPARQNHRVIPLTICKKPWGFQYSPYVYYNEHCIVFNREHTPMAINRDTFSRLLAFVEQFPHYFLGSNADLPIVGGSILSHDHFQGGRYEFAMAKAPVEEETGIPGFSGIQAGIVRWPMSVLRLRAEDPEELTEAAGCVLDSWRGYTDEAAFIYAQTGGEPHNTITPIARIRDGLYELDLVLRNNITTKEHPLGVFHPHEELHHIKKENIGLIEVMGLAVLPARLREELSVTADLLVSGGDLRADERTAKHADWAEDILRRYGTVTRDNAEAILHKEVGDVFCRVLEDAGVYKRTPEGKEAFRRFIRQIKP